jgi:hypothetical protein
MDNYSKTSKKYVAFGEIVLSYLAVISFFLLIQYSRAPKWRLFIDHFIKASTLQIVAAVASAYLLYSKRDKILSLIKTDTVRYSLLFITALLGVYFKLPFIEIILFFYAVYAILFINSSIKITRFYQSTGKLTQHILSALFDVESRTPALIALILIVIITVLMMLKKVSAAETTAIYVYYLLVITVVLQIMETKMAVTKGNRIIEDIASAYSCIFLKKNDDEQRTRISDAFRKAGQGIIAGNKMKHLIVLAIILAGLYAAKISYWKSITHALGNNPELRSTLSLIAGNNGNYMFPSYTDEITVPIRVKHPVSNPLWWPDSGQGAVSICIEWYSGSDADGRMMLFEDFQTIPKPLFINDSSDVIIKLKRPFVPSGNTYEVRIGLYSDGKKWFARSAEDALRIHVQIEKLSGEKAIAYEQNAHDFLQRKVEESMSERLSSSVKDYRSRLEILEDVLLSPTATHRITVTNRGRLPWPAHYKHAVKLGIAWMQKSGDGAGAHFVHTAVDNYPLPQVLLPGKSTTVYVSIDPRKAPEVDEIWIGMVHDGKTWFYNKGDAVIKLPNIKNKLAQQLSDLQKENSVLDKELVYLKGKGAHSPEVQEGAAIFRDDDYRSKIKLVENISTDRILENANRLRLDLELTNTGNIPWAPSDGPNKYPVNLGILWFNKSGNVTFVSPRIAEERCIFPFNILTDMTVRMQCAIGDKIMPGKYEVWVGLVHERTAWFYEKGDAVLKLSITVQ